VSVQRKAHVHHTDDGGHDVTNVGGLVVVTLWDVQLRRRDRFLPTQAHVRSEDDYRSCVEKGPSQRLKELELQTIDVTHFNHLLRIVAVRVVHPEQRQEVVHVDNALRVDEVRWRAQLVCSGLTETELEQVDCHESQEADARDNEIQATRLWCCSELHVPGPLQCHQDVQKGSQSHVDLHNVCWKSKTSPVETHIEISVTIEVVWTEEDVKVSNGVDDDEQEQPHRRPGQTTPVVCENEVCLSKMVAKERESVGLGDLKRV